MLGNVTACILSSWCSISGYTLHFLEYSILTWLIGCRKRHKRRFFQSKHNHWLDPMWSLQGVESSHSITSSIYSYTWALKMLRSLRPLFSRIPATSSYASTSLRTLSTTPIRSLATQAVDEKPSPVRAHSVEEWVLVLWHDNWVLIYI